MKEYALAATLVEAMTMADRMKADGVPIAEREIYLENVLRKAWPHTRAWTYYCELCGDTGYRLFVCDPERPLCGRRAPHLAHDYVEACTCRRGVTVAEKLRPKKVAAVDEAGKRMTRVGRYR